MKKSKIWEKAAERTVDVISAQLRMWICFVWCFGALHFLNPANTPARALPGSNHRLDSNRGMVASCFLKLKPYNQWQRMANIADKIDQCSKSPHTVEILVYFILTSFLCICINVFAALKLYHTQFYFLLSFHLILYYFSMQNSLKRIRKTDWISFSFSRETNTCMLWTNQGYARVWSLPTHIQPCLIPGTLVKSLPGLLLLGQVSDSLWGHPVASEGPSCGWAADIGWGCLPIASLHP